MPDKRMDRNQGVGKEMRENAAQQQHYVPRFILRNFASHENPEQVHVLNLRNKRSFTTSVKNVMGERRFHDFAFGASAYATFEPAIGRIEDEVLPTYRGILESRQLTNQVEEKARLALLIAFQFLRTRAQRDQFWHIERQFERIAAQVGGTLDEIVGYEALTEEGIKRQHILLIKESIGKLASMLSSSDFLLVEAGQDRSFYLSDHPVALHNGRPNPGPYSNMGFNSRGIEVYLPLSSSLMLCAWCPTILASFASNIASEKRRLAASLLSPTIRVDDADELAQQLASIKKHRASIVDLLERVAKGIPILADGENMDFYNSIQVGQAREYIICQQADFALARRFIDEHPKGDNSWTSCE